MATTPAGGAPVRRRRGRLDVLPGRQPQQGVDHPRPQGRGRPRRPAAPGRPGRRAGGELPHRRAGAARPRDRRAHRAQPAPGGALGDRVRPRRPRGRAGRLRPDRAGRGGPDVADRLRSRRPATGGGADRGPAGRHVRRVRRPRRAPRADPHRRRRRRAHLAAGRRRRGARLPGHPVDGGRRGRARPGQPPPLHRALRAVPLPRRRRADLGRLRGAVAEVLRRLRPRRRRRGAGDQPRAGREPGAGDRGRRGRVRRHGRRAAAGPAGRGRDPRRQGPHPRRGVRLGPGREPGADGRPRAPQLGTITTPGPPLRFFTGDGSEVTHRDHTAAPLLGEHADAVRRWLDGSGGESGGETGA